MAKIKIFAGTKDHRVVTRREWLAARKTLLAKEKRYTRLGDRLNSQRRALPWEKVEREYVFDGPNGKETLAQLFGKNSRLIVCHFMFPPEWKTGCPHCSFWADHYDATLPHLGQRDTSLVVVSRAPIAKINAFKKRMGWHFKWLSSGGTDFNYDFHASFRPEDSRGGSVFYNYEKVETDASDREGASVFYKDPRGEVYHTYSCYARGIDVLNGTYHLLDLTPKGRDEDSSDPQSWVDYHDRYKD